MPAASKVVAISAIVAGSDSSSSRAGIITEKSEGAENRDIRQQWPKGEEGLMRCIPQKPSAEISMGCPIFPVTAGTRRRVFPQVRAAYRRMECGGSARYAGGAMSTVLLVTGS